MKKRATERVIERMCPDLGHLIASIFLFGRSDHIRFRPLRVWPGLTIFRTIRSWDMTCVSFDQGERDPFGTGKQIGRGVYFVRARRAGYSA